MFFRCVALAAFTLAASVGFAAEPNLKSVKYNNPGLVVDLGVGLWAFPLPMDYDGDGDLDLVVSCPDKPYNGTYFFENPSDGKDKFPVFKPGVKIGPGHHHIRVSYVDGTPHVLVPGKEFTSFLETKFETSQPIKVDTGIFKGKKLRSNQWHLVDWNGDDKLDLVIGFGDWSDYGWDDAWDSEGNWENGPLHGRIAVALNTGSNEAPTYEKVVEVLLKDSTDPLEVYGWPSPNIADWDGDGDLDILCGEFVDTFTYFENVGSRTAPEYAAGRKLMHDGEPIRMDLEMIVPSAIDWDADGDLDLIVGDEDGRVALVENTGRFAGGTPGFLPPQYFQQEADDLKFGALATPFGYDWDGDGDEDLLCGNTAGYIGFFENLGGGETPKWNAPVLLKAGDETFRVMAGPNGSIQGPCEAKWGYTTISVADWNHDGLPDILFNSIWGKIEWLENIGTRSEPKLAAAKPIEVEWTGPTPKPEWTWWTPEGKALVTQWRTTPNAVDWNNDGLCDLVLLDTEGFLSLYAREKRGDQLVLMPPQRIFYNESGAPLQLNEKRAGGSGRRKIAIVDWDGDGRRDLLLNGANADYYRQVDAPDGQFRFTNLGPLDERPLAGHTSSPTTVDWNGDGVRDLVVGSESGYIYYLRNPNPAK